MQGESEGQDHTHLCYTRHAMSPETPRLTSSTISGCLTNKYVANGKGGRPLRHVQNGTGSFLLFLTRQTPTMLRKYLLFAAALLPVHLSMAQGRPYIGDGANIIDHMLIKEAKDVTSDESRFPIEGTPYLDEEFTKGTVITQKGIFSNVEMRYNIHTDVIEFRQKGITYQLDPVPEIIRVDMGDRRLVVGAEDNKGRLGFYEMLDSGAVTLLSRPKVVFREGKPPQALQAKPTPARYMRLPDVYYYRAKGGPITRITSLKKLLADMPGDAAALKAFVDKEKISTRKREDLVRLFQHCNGTAH
jgi:hypothetical protein